MISPKLYRYEWLYALLFFALCFVFIYPDLVFLERSPMEGGGLALKDRTVSWSVYMPAFRELRYELLNHFNILWSNLRGMGEPILANGVQGAPLFPLNLALIWMPDHLFWSVMPILRILFIALATYLIARRIFKLSLAASIIFTLICAFNLNVLRWINHPWENGFLAGLWYFYFIARIYQSELTDHKAIWFKALGVVISVFAMITTGFPEGALLAAFLTTILFIGFVSIDWKNVSRHFSSKTWIILIAHIIGFSLSAVQIFSLVEYVDLSQTMEDRESISRKIYVAEEAFTFWLSQFSIFEITGKQLKYITFYTGLFGLFFATRGIAWFISLAITRQIRGAQIFLGLVFLASMSLFAVKTFGLSETVEWIFANSPLLAQSYITLYFSPIFFFGIGYFAAFGVERFITLFDSNRTTRIIDLIFSLIGFVLVVKLSMLSVSYFNNETIPISNFFFLTSEYTIINGFTIGAMLIIALTVLSLNPFFYTQIKRYKVALQTVTLITVVALMINELDNTLQKDFTPFRMSPHAPTPSLSKAIEDAQQAAPVPAHELRGIDGVGRFIGDGLATVDNGVSAILPANIRLLRRHLFNVKYGGRHPLGKPKRAWSYDTLSANIFSVHTTPVVDKEWEGIQPAPVTEASFSTLAKQVQASDQNTLYMEGSVIGNFSSRLTPEIWVKLQSTSQSMWIKANIKNRRILDPDPVQYKLQSNWRILIPIEWLNERSYSITVRQANLLESTYVDSAAERVTMADNQEPSAKPQLLSSTDDKSRLIYFKHSALPRAFVANSCAMTSSLEETSNFFLSSDRAARGTVLLNTDDQWDSGFCDTYKGDFARVPIREDNGTRLTLDSVQGPALLVVNDTFYPGWQAIDKNRAEGDAPLTIKFANTTSRAVYLPDSKIYSIEMAYKPWWLNWVYALLLIAILMLIVLWKYLQKLSVVSSVQ